MTYQPSVFGTIAVAGEDDVKASAANQTLTLVEGANVTLTTDDITGSVTIAAASGSSGITALTGDVTASGTGSVVATIADEAVTLAKMADIATEHLIGRHAAGSGVPQIVGLDGGLEFHGANIRRSALTGDVTASAGSNTTTIAATLDTIPAPVAAVDFNAQEATSFRIENRTSDPGTPTVGQIWLRTDLP